MLLFIVTDSRAIKYIAKTSLDTAGLSYESIEGNLFNGLEIKRLSYESKPLFSSALIHWNPLTLLHDKITIHKLDARGIELENIMAMVEGMKSESSEKKIDLDFEIVIKKTHLEINPYLFEGVKFSSFVFETGQIELDKNLTINTNSLYLKFDSDIVNVKMNAKIEENQLLVDNLDLKDISTKEITKLTRRLRAKNRHQVKNRDKSNERLFFKDIKIKHIMGTLKAVQYSDLKIKGATLHLYDALIKPSKNFSYQVKRVDFKGKTNFGKLEYKGAIKDSTIEAKGYITLNKNLFTQYALPLNFQALEKLPSTLRLNHDAVWIDIEHEAKKLLEIQSDFNVDVLAAKHKLHYDYRDRLFTVESDIDGQMSYANAFKLKNRVLIDKAGLFSYGGEVEILKLNNLPSIISEYLATDIKAQYKANAHEFEMNLESALLTGHGSMPNYKGLNLSLQSKGHIIKLNKLLSDLPVELSEEKISLDSQSFFDFKNIEASQIKILAHSDIVDVDANMKLNKPYEIFFKSKINSVATLEQMIPKLNFNPFKELQGSVRLEENNYLINFKNQEVKFFMNYNLLDGLIEEAIVGLNTEEFRFERNSRGNLSLQANVLNVQDLLSKLKHFYAFEAPNIQGEIDFQVEQQSSGAFSIKFQSKKLQYLLEESVDLSIVNVYDIEAALQIDKDLNIEIENYQFKLDDNGYVNRFYSTKASSLALRDNSLEINQLWINDKIKVHGNYDIASLQGNLKIDANRYELSTKDFALVLGLDLMLKLDKEKIDIEGNIDIWGDTISYEIEGTSIVEDSDIVILEDMIREKESAFNNFKLYLKIKNKKPLKYIADKVNIEFVNELSLLKNYNQKMLLTGMTTITKGSYIVEDKEFSLDESHLYFTGDMKAPLLDIKANYEKDQYNIHIFLSGTTDAPIINFNSEPYLTQQEILSLILFDGTGSSSGNGAEAYTLLGGTLAKGLIKSFGIDIVDHLLLGTDSNEQLSLEIGTKISKDISVLYLHKDGLDGVKVRVEHSNSFETDIIIQPPNTSSIEFLYKQTR